MSTCASCGGSGWIITETNGVSGAERCVCRQRKTKPVKPTAVEILEMVGRIAAANVIPFFPQTEEAWIMLTSEIQSFVSDRQEIALFTQNLLRYCKKYEGPAGLRQIYCAFSIPADGIYPAEALPGFSSDEGEARAKRREMEENDRVMAEYKRQALLGPPEDRAPLLLPEPQTLAPLEPAENKIPGFQPDSGGTGIIRSPRSLAEREEELALAVKAVKPRSAVERRRLVEELRAKLANMAPAARSAEIQSVTE
jgi:hypothetical protein